MLLETGVDGINANDPAAAVAAVEAFVSGVTADGSLNAGFASTFGSSVPRRYVAGTDPGAR